MAEPNFISPAPDQEFTYRDNNQQPITVTIPILVTADEPPSGTRYVVRVLLDVNGNYNLILESELFSVSGNYMTLAGLTPAMYGSAAATLLLVFARVETNNTRTPLAYRTCYLV